MKCAMIPRLTSVWERVRNSFLSLFFISAISGVSKGWKKTTYWTTCLGNRGKKINFGVTNQIMEGAVAEKEQICFGYAVGVQSFDHILEHGSRYIDKTEYV